MLNKYNQMFAECLMAAYMYYYENKILMTDEEYDQKFLQIRDNWNNITNNNKLKDLIDINSLYKSTSLYYIQKYPEGLKQIALKWYSLLEV